MCPTNYTICFFYLIQLNMHTCPHVDRKNSQTVHIVPKLSEGTWWSSDSVMYFFGSSGAKD